MKKIQLFLLHFAGGNCYSYQFLTPLLKVFDVFSLELPGRGKRTNEILLKDFDKATEDIFEQIISKLNTTRFIIYGHSMGAYLGLRVACMLEKVNLPPSYLIVSGNPGPEAKVECYNKRYLLGKEEFINELKNLGGGSIELYENYDLFAYLEPILRADFEIVEKNNLTTKSLVNIPIYALMGSIEENADLISSWGKCTTSSLKYEILEGDHFFIYKHSTRIAAILKECCSELASL